jgi:putative sugar O-methyltransferase
MNINEMVNYFISRSPQFYQDTDLNNIDLKHKEVIDNAYTQIDKSNNFSFRNWTFQTDLGAPSQINLKLGIFLGFIRPLYKKIFQWKQEASILQALLDDIHIINSIDATHLLEENPVHKTPGYSNYYRIGNNTVNFRWLRYIYLAKRIFDLNILKNGGVWLDIGPYYGGLQGLVLKYNPKARIVLLDFHHQLCRSYIYLSKLYPNANHVFPDQINKISSFQSLPEASIVYVPVNQFKIISNYKVDITTNFFSFGEMKRDFFISYMSSDVVSKSKFLYLVNRFVSAPFFEPTYDTDLNIFDYIDKDRKVDYFDIFPMHHYYSAFRKLFGRNGSRNVSSSYFEQISSINK